MTRAVRQFEKHGRYLVLAALLAGSGAFAETAEDRRIGERLRADAVRFAALEGLKPGLRFPRARHRLLRAGWHPYRERSSRSSSACDGARWVCRRHREASGCWTESGKTICSMVYLETARRPPRLDDEILRLRVRVTPDGRLLYESHQTASFGGHG